ncbi:MAG TPA: hypothetical protein VG125_13880 [Pirellulales bacterium]|jgi:hypothetical protein|nr:hypothetical protein [Pirellulales bacterium]
MRTFFFALGVALVAAPLSWAFDEAPKKKPPAKEAAPAKEDDEKSVADQIQTVQTEFIKKQRDVIARYRATEDDAERQKILAEYSALQTDLIDKYAAIVEKHPDDEASFTALQQLISSPEHAAKATALLLKHHLGNDQIGTLCLQLGMQGMKDAEPLVRAVAEKSKNHDAKGLAFLGLGQMLLAASNEDGLDDAKRDELRGQAKEALKTVVESYPDVDAFRRKAGDWAGTVLFEAEHLAVGVQVPDLAGEDLEGEEFKLSDYRGKVVFLDFWAHW